MNEGQELVVIGGDWSGRVEKQVGSIFVQEGNTNGTISMEDLERFQSSAYLWEVKETSYKFVVPNHLFQFGYTPMAERSPHFDLLSSTT